MTSFFGPASVTLPATATAEPPSQDASQNKDYPSSTQTASNNDDQTLLEQEHDDEVPTAETGEGDIDIVRSGPVQIEEFNFPQSQATAQIN